MKILISQSINGADGQSTVIEADCSISTNTETFLVSYLISTPLTTSGGSLSLFLTLLVLSLGRLLDMSLREGRSIKVQVISDVLDTLVSQHIVVISPVVLLSDVTPKIDQYIK